MALGSVDSALNDFNRALELQPDRSGLLGERASAFAALGRMNEALEDLNRAIGSAQPEEAWLYSRRADVHTAMRDFDAARADFESALAAAPSADDDKSRRARAGAQNSLAWILATTKQLELRDPSRAVELAELAVATSPEDGNIWNTLGVARYRNGDWAGAQESLQKSMALAKGGNVSDWFFFAMTYWRLGDKVEARQWFDKAVEWMEKNQPRNEELQRFHAEAAELLGIVEAE